MTEESEFLGHCACSACGSSDGGSLYSDGHIYCFVCKALTPGDGPVTQPRRTRMGDVEFVDGDFRALVSRKLSEAICKKFGYKVGTDKNGDAVQIAPYYGEDGQLTAQKLRYADKTFKVLGGGKNMPLFGRNLWATGGKRIVVTEGEIDAMSVCQAFGGTWAAVSVPNGAQSAARSVKQAIEFLESYEQVVFMFDMDEPGQAAATECAAALTPGKAAIASLPLKDANEMVKADRIKELTTAVYQARAYRPDGIVSLSDIRGRVLEVRKPGLPWFLPGMTKATFGRYPGDVILLGGGTGCGKTDLITAQIAYDVTQLGCTVGVLALEQGVGDSGRRVAGKTVGKRFHVPDGSWTQAELETAWNALEATNRLHFYDNFGAMDWATIKSKIIYMAQALGCTVVYLDHLTALAAQEDDERKALERIMAELAGMAKSLGLIIIAVSHLTTPETGKPHEEGGRVTGRHFKGSRAIQFWSHGMFGLERDTQASDPVVRSTTTLRCLKDRLSGDATGETWELSYDPKTGLLSEKPASAPAPEEDDPPF